MPLAAATVAAVAVVAAVSAVSAPSRAGDGWPEVRSARSISHRPALMAAPPACRLDGVRAPLGRDLIGLGGEREVVGGVVRPVLFGPLARAARLLAAIRPGHVHRRPRPPARTGLLLLALHPLALEPGRVGGRGSRDRAGQLAEVGLDSRSVSAGSRAPAVPAAAPPLAPAARNGISQRGDRGLVGVGQRGTAQRAGSGRRAGGGALSWARGHAAGRVKVASAPWHPQGLPSVRCLRTE